MPKTFEPRIETFADLVVSEAKRVSKLRYNASANEPTIIGHTSRLSALTQAAARLPSIKRFSYNETCLDLVEKTYAVDLEEIVGALHHVTFPFDDFWIAGYSDIRRTMEIGGLIKSDQEKKEFSVLPFYRHRLSDTFIAPFIETFDVRITVSAENGIKLDEDKLLKLIEAANSNSAKNDNSDMIDGAYFTGAFYARLFAVLSSSKISSNFLAEKTPADLALEEKNKIRMRIGRPPILPESPILVDLSRVNMAALDRDNANNIKRELLGVTSVRRSKEIVSKYGVHFRRKPHKRRIPSNVDRTLVVREIFSSDPNVTFEVRNGRPVQVRTSPLADEQGPPVK